MIKYSPFGNDLFGNPISFAEGVIAKKFEFPPFSVLDARQGEWQDRKRAWIACGIKSELGRDCKDFAIVDKETWTQEQKEKGGLTFKGHAASFDYYRVKEGIRKETDTQGTSIFDPVLCELMYRWFCPEGGQIVDPFAGGSVRGIVASLLGFKYCGIDLSSEQIKANEEQKKEICPEGQCSWFVGDALDCLDYAPPADLIFSCPPYGDLEVYSDDPRDVSSMDYHAFIACLKRIILKCQKILKPNRYACFVVGDFRDKKGNLRGFPADVIKAFQAVEMPLYNELILVTSVGSLPIRITKQFEAGRKIGKTHQNILVFKKV